MISVRVQTVAWIARACIWFRAFSIVAFGVADGGADIPVFRIAGIALAFSRSDTLPVETVFADRFAVTCIDASVAIQAVADARSRTQRVFTLGDAFRDARCVTIWHVSR